MYMVAVQFGHVEPIQYLYKTKGFFLRNVRHTEEGDVSRNGEATDD
jgi:hypothetical protein